MSRKRRRRRPSASSRARRAASTQTVSGQCSWESNLFCWCSSFSRTSWRLTQMFFVAPDFQVKRAVRGFQPVDHSPNAPPAVFLIELRRSIVADRAREPGSLDAVGGKPPLGIAKQRRCESRAPRGPRDVELIEFVVFDHAKSDGLTRWAYDSHARNGCPKPVPEVLQRTMAGKFRRQDPCVRILPAVVPKPCQVIDLNFFGCSHIHSIS